MDHEPELQVLLVQDVLRPRYDELHLLWWSQVIRVKITGEIVS
jgi:hypothetical protein